MECGSETKPRLSMAHGQSVNFRGPIIFEAFSIQTDCSSCSVTCDSLTFAACMRGHQLELGTGHEPDAWQCRGFLFALNQQEVLERQRCANRRKAELLRAIFKNRGGRSVCVSGGSKGNPVIEGGACG